MLKCIYTPALTFVQPASVMLPLNPFRVIQNQLNVIAAAWLEGVVPEFDILSVIFGSTFQLGTAVVPNSLLQVSCDIRSELTDAGWELSARSPGLKAIPQLVSDDAEF